MRATKTQKLTDSEAWRFDCRGKTPFKDERRAQHRAKQIRRESGEDLHSYRCRFCHRWHLGH